MGKLINKDIVKQEAIKRLMIMRKRIKQAASDEITLQDDTLIFIQELKDIAFLIGLVKDL